MEPDAVQTEVVLDASVTAPPDEAVAETVRVPVVNESSVNDPNVID